jgi:hypothetical protein
MSMQRKRINVPCFKTTFKAIETGPALEELGEDCIDKLILVEDAERLAIRKPGDAV